MRTTEQFAAIFNEAKWFVKFHNKPVWLVALDNSYVLSVVRPDSSEIAKGTSANLYNTDMEVIDTVRSKK